MSTRTPKNMAKCHWETWELHDLFPMFPHSQTPWLKKKKQLGFCNYFFDAWMPIKRQECDLSALSEKRPLLPSCRATPLPPPVPMAKLVEHLLYSFATILTKQRVSKQKTEQVWENQTAEDRDYRVLFCFREISDEKKKPYFKFTDCWIELNAPR